MEQTLTEQTPNLSPNHYYAMRHLDYAYASSRSRASPYASKYKKTSLHASMGEAFSYLLSHGSLPTRILSLWECFDSLKSPQIGDLCMTVLHMCCMRLTAHMFPELLISLTKKGLILWKYILLTTINTRTELILLLLIIHFYSYPVLMLKRISILHLTLKGLLITLQLIIRLCMPHLLLIASCRHNLMLLESILLHVLNAFKINLCQHIPQL